MKIYAIALVALTIAAPGCAMMTNSLGDIIGDALLRSGVYDKTLHAQGIYKFRLSDWYEQLRASDWYKKQKGLAHLHEEFAEAAERNNGPLTKEQRQEIYDRCLGDINKDLTAQKGIIMHDGYNIKSVAFIAKPSNKRKGEVGSRKLLVELLAPTGSQSAIKLNLLYDLPLAAPIRLSPKELEALSSKKVSPGRWWKLIQGPDFIKVAPNVNVAGKERAPLINQLINQENLNLGIENVKKNILPTIHEKRPGSVKATEEEGKSPVIE